MNGDSLLGSVCLSGCLLIGQLVMADYAPIDIQTRDGQTFQDAVVEGINPGGIDIGYINADGHYVLKGLAFKDLPEELQKRFGYNPEQEQKFNRRVRSYSGKSMEKVTEDAKTRLERVVREIKEKFAGGDITIRPEDLRFAIHSGRCSVKVRTVAPTRSGCVVQVIEHISDAGPRSDVIQIDGDKLPADGDWSGFIYPTGLKARFRGGEVPVYTDSLDHAAELVDNYLEIYSAYAAADPEESDLTDAAPEQSMDGGNGGAPADGQQAQGTSGGSAPQTDGQTAAAPGGSSDKDSSDRTDYDYYIGLSYRPVCWWNTHHHRPHHGAGQHRPHRPGWVHPQRPDFPNWNRPRPPRPPHPNNPAQPPSPPSNRPDTPVPPVAPSNPHGGQQPAAKFQTLPMNRPVRIVRPDSRASDNAQSAHPAQRSSFRTMGGRATTAPSVRTPAPSIQRSGNFSRLQRY